MFAGRAGVAAALKQWSEGRSEGEEKQELSVSSGWPAGCLHRLKRSEIPLTNPIDGPPFLNQLKHNSITTTRISLVEERMKLVFLFLLEKRLCSAAISFNSTQWAEMEVISVHVVFRAAHSWRSQCSLQGGPSDGSGAGSDAAAAAAGTHAEGANRLLQLLMKLLQGCIENTRGRKYHFHPLQSKTQLLLNSFQNKSMKTSMFSDT